jgi:hypothetical protein
MILRVSAVFLPQIREKAYHGQPRGYLGRLEVTTLRSEGFKRSRRE